MSFLATRFGVGVVAAVAILIGVQSYLALRDSRVEQGALGKVHKQNAKATKIGRQAAARSGRRGAGRVCPTGYRECSGKRKGVRKGDPPR